MEINPAPFVIPAEVEAVFREFRTCEFSTLAKDGAPITWPTLPFWDPAAQRFIVTASVGYPQKVYNVRRDGRVALLFSDPTASGLAHPPSALIQGDAVASDKIETSIEDIKDGLRLSYERQPGSMIYSANPLTRYFSDWYYMRLLITVTPRAMFWLPEGDAAATPQSITRLTPPPAPPPATPNTDVTPATAEASLGVEEWRRLVSELATYQSAVLTGIDGEGYPYSVRCQPQVDHETSALKLKGVTAPIWEGAASLLCHSHDDHLWRQRSFLVRGYVGRHENDIWYFQPSRLVPGISQNPLELGRFFMSGRRTAAQYLARRHLPRPTIPWDDIIRIKREAQANLRSRGETF
jgi:hypothetical protein